MQRRFRERLAEPQPGKENVNQIDTAEVGEGARIEADQPVAEASGHRLKMYPRGTLLGQSSNPSILIAEGSLPAVFVGELGVVAPDSGLCLPRPGALAHRPLARGVCT